MAADDRDAPEKRVTVPRLERISQRAHALYEARGGQNGRDLEDWLRAEREIDSEDSATDDRKPE